MICGAGVGDDLDIALWHVAADTVVGWLLLHSGRDRQLAALVGMTGQAFGGKVCRSLFVGWLYMRIVAGDAAHTA